LKTSVINRHCSLCSTRINSVLKDCSPSCLDAISESKQCITYEKGNRVQISGGIVEGLFCLKHGKIKVFRNCESGEEVISRFIKPGEIFGSKDYRASEGSFSGSSLEDSEVCFIEQSALLSIINTHPELGVALIKFYQEKINEVEGRHYTLSMMNVPSKVAYALLVIHEAYGNAASGMLNLQLSRKEIAGLASTTKEQVSKALSEFKRAGIIRTHGRQIEIVDLERLRQAARW